MQPEDRGLIGHIERHLGVIQRGWNADADGRRLPFRIVECKGSRYLNVSAFSTIGLSEYPLQCALLGKIIRMEFVMLSSSDAYRSRIVGAVMQVASEVHRSQNALVRGHVIGPRGPLVEGSALEALYVAVPVYHPDSFRVYESSGGISVVMAWLVPITSAEAGFVAATGWNAFEDILEAADPDLLDFSRPSVV